MGSWHPTWGWFVNACRITYLHVYSFMVSFSHDEFFRDCGSKMQLKILTNFSKDGLIGSLSTNTETSTLLEKVMQVTMFLNCEFWHRLSKLIDTCYASFDILRLGMVSPMFIMIWSIHLSIGGLVVWSQIQPTTGLMILVQNPLFVLQLARRL